MARRWDADGTIERSRRVRERVRGNQSHVAAEKSEPISI